MYHFWTPLTGLVAVGSAFTVQPWLSICDLVVGIILLHSHIFQVFFKRCGGKCKEVENVLVLAALMLSIVTLIVRIAQTSGREVWFFDVIYLVSTTFACICCVVRSCHHSHNSEAVEFRKVSISEPLDAVANETRSWWREAAQSSFQEATLVLPKLWSPR